MPRTSPCAGDSEVGAHCCGNCSGMRCWIIRINTVGVYLSRVGAQYRVVPGQAAGSCL